MPYLCQNFPGMPNYLEFEFKVKPVQPWSEILMAELITVGFDSFTEEADGILGYIPAEDFNEAALQSLNSFQSGEVEISYSFREMPNINWNEEWEKNFAPIEVADRVRIRAEFHPADPSRHEIIIQPKMSFGTGHHPTTHLMVEQMMDLDFLGKSVLDMGCGTSVLGIYAKQLGARRVLGIDIDEWAVENSVENAQRNGVELEVKLGTAESLTDEKFDIILANINRNILLNDIPAYNQVLQSGGLLLLSGLCFFDVDDILKVTQSQGLTLKNQQQREEWVCLLLEK